MGANKIESEYNEINSKNGWLMTYQVINFVYCIDVIPNFYMRFLMKVSMISMKKKNNDRPYMLTIYLCE